jgi:choline dehydrogenase-like flavoprotein
MGENENNSVVDRNCKVHSVDNLFIGGASIMPTSSYANTGLTSLAFAYRLSEQL